ncbi:hypothetical protein Gogos_005841, partial [Gossypium gossypioides]|nr:hypothetical protein [Gossypium gossypioides]
MFYERCFTLYHFAIVEELEVTLKYDKVLGLSSLLGCFEEFGLMDQIWRMQSLEENNRQMMETISKLAYSSSTQQIQLVNEDGNTFDRTTLLDVNTKNGNNIPTNPFSSGNTNVANPLVTITGVTLTTPGASTGVVSTSTVIASKTTSQGYVTKKKLQRLLEKKNEILSFSEFDLKLPYPTMFVETLGVVELDGDLKLKEFSKSLTENTYKVLSTQEKVTLIDLGREHYWKKFGSKTIYFYNG